MAKDIVSRVYKDLKYSAEKMYKLHEAIKEDFKFEQGEQWKHSDVVELEQAGIKALTINKIKPIIKLITGIERQSRSDFKAFPEGGEDELTSEISTRLMKNVSKNSKIEIKLSEQFKNGCIGGMCFIEPYIDYSFDLINGDLKWKKVSGRDVYLDPDFQEYDLSDAKFVIRITKDLNMDDLEMLFPDDKKKLDKITIGRLDMGMLSSVKASDDVTNYPLVNEKEIISGESKSLYDLVDYYYKELQERYYVVIKDKGIIKEFETKEEAIALVEQVGMGDILSRKVPVIMHAQVVGNVELYNEKVWSYPRWKSYPLIPYFAELITEDLDDLSLTIQGIVRGIKDLNLEYNKRRTQELRHLNSSANSGFDIEEGQLSKEEEFNLKRFGSSPGFVAKRKKGTPPLGRISPMPLSQGHSQLAAENAQDLKEASGVNPDLLANDSQSQSGRAILFKQRQGLQMIQEMLDNFGETKKLVGRFILSQISELFTVETVMRVLGDAFISENFTVPVTAIKDRALQKVQEGQEGQLTELENSVLLQYPTVPLGQPIVDEQNNLIPAVDFDAAITLINTILSETQLNKYDIAIGEGPFSETIKLANFTDLKELAQQGVPIPPESLIETSMLPQAQKNKILRQLAAMAQASQAQIAAPQSE